MTNAELIATIRNEIERRKGKHSEDYKNGDTTEFHRIVEDDAILSFLSTIEPVTDCHKLDESEKPMNLDLEIEIEDYVEQRWQFAEDLNAAVPIYLYDMTLNELKDCARHFYEIGCRRTAEKYDEIEYNRQMAEERQMEKETPNDLEEAAEEYSFNIPSKLFHLLSEEQQILWKKEIEQAYLAGAVNEREKIMKEAVKGEYDQYPAAIYLPAPLPRMNKGDKVRLIIVKED